MATSIYLNQNEYPIGTYTVYITINLINLNYYIGVHKISKKPTEYYGSGYRLQRAIKKYGKENFSQRILFVTDNIKQAYDVEAKLVTEEFISRPDVYNLTVGGKIPPSSKGKKKISKNGNVILVHINEVEKYLNDGWVMGDLNSVGRIVSQETRERISQSNMDRIVSQETRERISLSQIGQRKGITLTESHKQAIRNSKKEISQETREKLSASASKRIHTQETKEKLRNINLGKHYGKMSDGHKEKLSLAHKGKILTEEHKRKISQNSSGRIWINNGIVSKFNKPENLQEELNNGWIFGRLYKRKP